MIEAARLFIVVLSILIASAASSISPSTLLAVPRIHSMRFDRSEVSQIYLAPGLGSVVLFPCSLSEVFVGRAEDLKAQISPNDKKVLLLNLKLNTSLPTNLIARCEGERNPYVFDIFPSRQRHQDVVEIRGSFGGPGLKRSEIALMKPANEKRTKIVLSAPVLTNRGGK